MDDRSADSSWSGQIKFHDEHPARLLGKLAAKPQARPRKQSLPYLRFAACFLGFCALDAVIYWYVMPRWNAGIEANRANSRSAPVERQQPTITTVATVEQVRQAAALRRQMLANTPAIIHEAATLADGLKCSGGLVYRTAEVDGVKEITVLMDAGKAVRCR